MENQRQDPARESDSGDRSPGARPTSSARRARRQRSAGTGAEGGDQQPAGGDHRAEQRADGGAHQTASARGYRPQSDGSNRAVGADIGGGGGGGGDDGGK